MSHPLYVFVLTVLTTAACGQTPKPRAPMTGATMELPMDPSKLPSTASDNRAGRWVKPADLALQQRLTPMQYRVTQKDGTEPAFHNAYWDNHQAGLYVDIATGEPLFSSADKFDSGTGWPSFVRPIEDGRVVSRGDSSHGMDRNEVRSRAGDSHLGHVFDDGPRERGGLRYCINSAALAFVPLGDMEAAGYGAWRSHVATGEPPIANDTDNACVRPEPGVAGGPGCQTTFETAILAGGCFWGMEDLLRKIPGVLETQVGYIGGSAADPTYEAVRTGRSGHAEAVRVVFDPSQLRFAELLEKWFFRMHDPTTKNRQGNDVGSQYRSAIFVTTAEQKAVALAVKAKVDAAHFWKAPIVTEVVEAGTWTHAEDYHQDYLEKNPDGYTCHFMRE